jgi:hypothetical protein
VTLFQKLVIALATAFLAVMVYDRVQNYRHEAAARNIAKDRQMWDDYHRCVDFLPYPLGANEEEQRVWLRARQGCLVHLGMPIQELNK